MLARLSARHSTYLQAYENDIRDAGVDARLFAMKRRMRTIADSAHGRSSL